jgi:hypothetical protein
MTQSNTSLDTAVIQKNNYKKYFFYFIIIFSIIILLVYSGLITINTSSNYKNNSIVKINEEDKEPIEKYINIFMLKQDEAISNKD